MFHIFFWKILYSKIINTETKFCFFVCYGTRYFGCICLGSNHRLLNDALNYHRPSMSPVLGRTCLFNLITYVMVVIYFIFNIVFCPNIFQKIFGVNFYKFMLLRDSLQKKFFDIYWHEASTVSTLGDCAIQQKFRFQECGCRWGSIFWVMEPIPSNH